jgi:hypothetical protein
MNYYLGLCPGEREIEPMGEEKADPSTGNAYKSRILYEGPVRGLCAIAPNNVNTMACATVAGHNLGEGK